MSKLFLCGMTTVGNEANLRSMIKPIRQCFDGLCFTFHGDHLIDYFNPNINDGGASYLEGQVGDGRIVYTSWCNRHSFSMNHFLYQCGMEDGDHFVLLDTLERLSPHFAADLRNLTTWMDGRGIAMVANYGKGLIFRFNEQLEFRGSPHWYATGLDGQAVNVELTKEDFWNERAAQRDEYEWVTHYLRYFTYPAGSNHAQLGLDHHKGKPEDVFPIRERKRLHFLAEMKRAGFPRTVEGFVAYASQPLTQVLCDGLNSDKVWQDAYWYLVRGDLTVKDNHDPATGKVVTLPPAAPAP
jgi:hypothetical protein